MLRLQDSTMNASFYCFLLLLPILGVSSSDPQDVVSTRDCDSGGGVGMFHNLTIDGCNGPTCTLDLYEDYIIYLTFTPQFNHSWSYIYFGISSNRSESFFLGANLVAGQAEVVRWSFRFSYKFASEPSGSVHTNTMSIGGSKDEDDEICRYFDVRLNTNVSGDGMNTGTELYDICKVPWKSCNFPNSLCTLDSDDDYIICLCDPHSIAEGKTCRRKLDEDCKVDSDCVSHGSCSSNNNKCVCANGFRPKPTDDKGACEPIVSTNECFAQGSSGTFEVLVVDGCYTGNCTVDLYQSQKVNMTFIPKFNHAWHYVIIGVSENRTTYSYTSRSALTAGQPHTAELSFEFNHVFAKDPTNNLHQMSMNVGGENEIVESCRTFWLRLNTNVTGDGLNTGTEPGQACIVPDKSCAFPYSMCSVNGGNIACACDSQSIPESKKCKRKITEPCKVDDDCLLEANCVDSRCLCREGFKPAATNTKCEKGSGTVVFVSMFMLLVQQLLVYSSR